MRPALSGAAGVMEASGKGFDDGWRISRASLASGPTCTCSKARGGSGQRDYHRFRRGILMSQNAHGLLYPATLG